MTLTEPTLTPPMAPSTVDMGQIFAAHAEREACIEALRPGNKDRLFDGLTAAGITHVTVTFDGAGNGGQIESIGAWAGDTAVDFPTTEIAYAALTRDDPEVEMRQLSLEDVVEQLAYDFLSDTHAAKEKARSWYRELGLHDDWWDAVYEDFERVCEILGIRLKTTPVRLMGGGTRAKPCIWFSGFWSQGDGAGFEGYWFHAKGAAARIRDFAPMDATLHGIADRLQAIQRRNFYQLAAEVSHRGRYYHEYTMSVDVTRDSPTWQPATEDAEEIVTEALCDLARWLYRQLEAEYDHLTSDEAIEEGIIVNEYSFTEAGRRFG